MVVREMNQTLEIIDHGFNIIQSRVIELTDRKIRLEKDIEHYSYNMNRYDMSESRNKLQSQLRVAQSRLREVEKMLLLNQSLLSFDDRHEYQLEN